MPMLGFPIFIAYPAVTGPIKGPFRDIFVVGNLTREEARTYFFDYVMPFHEHPPGANEAWERVYEVCGGNPGLLGSCALKVAKFSSWELGASRMPTLWFQRHTTALLPLRHTGGALALPVPRLCWCAHRAVLAGCDAVVQTAMTDISKGLLPETWNGAAWSTDDCRLVLQAIVSSQHTAVPVVELVAMLGTGGAAKLESMNQKNLLLRRAYDPLARDIDAAAFGPDFLDVYTLSSAAHLLAARRKLKL